MDLEVCKVCAYCKSNFQVHLSPKVGDLVPPPGSALRSEPLEVQAATMKLGRFHCEATEVAGLLEHSGAKLAPE